MAQTDVHAALAAAAAEFAENLYHCSRCNYCVEIHWEERAMQHVCPTLLYHSPAPGYAGKGYLAAARALVDGEELATAALAERFFSCTTCGNCEESCPIGLRPAQLVKKLRAEMVALGMAPAPIELLADNVVRLHNPGGQPVAERNRWAQHAAGISGQASALYLAGCAASYSLPGEARATVAILQQAGIELRLLPEGEARCCGAPLVEIGHVDAAEAERAALLDAIKRTACDTVITSGAECLESLLRDAPGVDVSVMHPFDLVERMAAAGTIRFETKAAATIPTGVAYFDSCHLSKKSHGKAGQANYPRRVRSLLANLGCGIVRMADEGNYAVCCGAAGGMPQVNPQSAAAMATGKLQACAAAGADLIVAQSPLCAAHLRGAAASDAPRIMGLFEFIDTYFVVRRG